MGARLAPALGAIFIDLDRLLAEVVGPSTDSIEISALQSFAGKWLAPRLAAFTTQYPAYPVRFVGADHLVDFDREQVDIGLRYGPGEYGPLHFERIAEARAFPVCSPAFLAAHARELKSPASLIDLPLLHDETNLPSLHAETNLPSLGLPSWPAWFGIAGLEGTSCSRGPLFESLHMALAAAVAGQGIALGLTPLVDDDLRSGALVRPFEIELLSPHAFWFVCRKDRLRERKIRVFRDWIIAATKGAPSS